MFHNITLPLWLARLLPMKAVAFQDLSLRTKARLAKRINIPQNTAILRLRPCQATMPMGLKWAVFVAHTFVSSCFDESFHLLKSSRLSIPSMKLSHLQDEHAPFLVRKNSPLLLHIIDDAVLVTVDWPPRLISTWHQLTRTVLRINGLPVAEKKSSNSSHIVVDLVHFIGCEWNLKIGIIAPSPDKLERVITQSRLILTAMTSPKHWKRITGKLVWFAMLNRPRLACTQRIFSAAHSTQPPIFQQSTASKRELRTLAALLLFARVDARLPLCEIIVAFDASQTAGAVTFAYAPPKLVERLWNAAQKARYDRHRDASSQLYEAEAIKQCTWKLAFVHYWKKSEHINCLEASTAVLTAEWITRFRISNARVIFLSDSLVTLGALQKGRSSKPGLLMRCSRFAAIALAHGLRISLAYVCSSLNPADKFTRIEKNPHGYPSASTVRSTHYRVS